VWPSFSSRDRQPDVKGFSSPDPSSRCLYVSVASLIVVFVSFVQANAFVVSFFVVAPVV
jgi:hypothetical protein